MKKIIISLFIIISAVSSAHSQAWMNYYKDKQRTKLFYGDTIKSPLQLNLTGSYKLVIWDSVTKKFYQNVSVSNLVLQNGSYSNPSWISSLAETKVLPTQTGNSGKFLTTNGTASSWSAPFTLTTTGTSGAATFSSGTLNIPQYAGGSSSIDIGTTPITSGASGQILFESSTNKVSEASTFKFDVTKSLIQSTRGWISTSGYASLSETAAGLSTILGSSARGNSTANEVEKTSADPASYIRLNYVDGITFHVNFTGASGTTAPASSTGKVLQMALNGDITFPGLSGTGNRIAVFDLNGKIGRNSSVDPADIGLLSATQSWSGANSFGNTLTAGAALVYNTRSVSSDANYTVPNDALFVKLPNNGVITADRTITFPSVSDGKILRIWNPESTFNWVISGTVVFASGGSVTNLGKGAMQEYIYLTSASAWVRVF